MHHRYLYGFYMTCNMFHSFISSLFPTAKNKYISRRQKQKGSKIEIDLSYKKFRGKEFYLWILNTLNYIEKFSSLDPTHLRQSQKWNINYEMQYNRLKAVMILDMRNKIWWDFQTISFFFSTFAFQSNFATTI